jgi:hypothetical protein
MAKTPTKTPAKTATKTAAKKAPSSSTNAVSSIEKASQEALTKLKTLALDPQLQADIEWCLGSYKSDQNPEGLYEMVQRAIAVFTSEKDKKTKGVTSKLITDLENALKVR